MPTSRPSAPATLSTTNAVALNALGVWLADADVDTPDLTSHAQPSAVRTGSPTFGTSVLGGEFKPSTDPSYLIAHPTVASVGSYPIIVGAIFSRAGTKSASSGFETIFSLGDAVGTVGSLYCAIGIDDGGQGTAGDVVGNLRSESGGGNVAIGNAGQYSAGVINAAVMVFYESAGLRKVAAFLNSTKVFDGNPSNDPGAFAGDVMNYAAALARIRGGANDLNASTSTTTACWWFSQTKLSDADYTTWTGDPWLILQAAGAAPQKAYPISDDSVGSWQRKGPGTEAVRNLLTYTEDFSNAAWVKSGCTISADAAADPDGALTADILVETTGLITHSVQQFVTLTDSLDYTLSIDAHPNARDWVLLSFVNKANVAASAYFNVTTGAIGTTVNCTAAITSGSNGYYIPSIVANAGTGATAPYVAIYAANADNSIQYSATANALDLVRAQLEQASSRGTYQPILATTPPLEVSSTNVFTALADGSTGTPDDSSYAFVLVPGDPYWFKFGPTTLPLLLSGTMDKLRAYSPQLRSLQIDVYQGDHGTLIATRTINLTASVAESDLSLTDPELALVTDLTDIHGRMVGL